MKRGLLVLLFVGFISQLSKAQFLYKEKLDSYFNALEENDKFMGSVVLSKQGTIVYSKTIGYLDVEKKLKANQNSKYRIGSISKTFTAVLVLKAFEEQLIDLDQTIVDYFPTIKNADQITIKQLLSHRSGIHNFTSDKDYVEWCTSPKTKKEVVGIISQGGSDFIPGSKSQYSNSNYVLLSFILETIYKQPFAHIIESKITKPLDLKNTYYGGTIDPQNQECLSYTFLGSWQVESQTDLSIPMGAGGIVSTASDLTKFSEALFEGVLLKSESLEMMKTLKDGFGLGLFQYPFDSHKGFGHTGGIDAFRSFLVHFIEDEITYAMVSNGSNYVINKINIAVLSAAFDQPFDLPEFSTFEVISADLDPYLGVYTSDQFPLDITISKKNNTLIAQATGQPSFALEAYQKNKFKFDQAGVMMEFNPRERTLLFKQAGREFLLVKE